MPAEVTVGMLAYLRAFELNYGRFDFVITPMNNRSCSSVTPQPSGSGCTIPLACRFPLRWPTCSLYFFLCASHNSHGDLDQARSPDP